MIEELPEPPDLIVSEISAPDYQVLRTGEFQ